MKNIAWITAGCFIDVDIDVVPMLSNQFKISWFILGDINKGDKLRLETIEKTNNLQIKYCSIKAKWYTPMAFLEYIKHIKEARRQGELLYVDCGGSLSFYQALDLCSNKDKTILAIHNVKTPKGARFERLAQFNTWYALHRFKNFHTFSKNQYGYLKSKVSGKNVLESPLMLKDYGRPSVKNNNNVFNFLAFGHIREYKRIDLLILAAQELFERTQKRFIVTIAGNCKEWERYQRLIKYPELFDLHIEFIENEDIPNYFVLADCLVLPYQDLAQSGAITVAFKYNVPVITSDIEQFVEFNGNNDYGFRFKSCDVYDLSLVMEKALSLSDIELQQMKEKQRDFVEKEFSASFILKKYKSFIDSL